jgi:hypothetical protein
LQDSVEVRVIPETELGAVQASPEGVEVETVNDTVLLKPLRFVIVIVDVAVLFAATGDGVTAPADTEKSTKWKAMVFVAWGIVEPLIIAVPVTLTV